MSSLDRQLMNLGLTNMQARTYMAILRLGQSSASDVAKESGVNRVTTYSTLEELEGMGLVQADDFDQVRLYQATDVMNLDRVFMLKAKEAIQAYRDAQGLLPDLRAAIKGPSEVPKTTYCEGTTDSLAYLKNLPENDDLHAAYIYDVRHYEYLKPIVKRACNHEIRPQAIIPNSVSADLLVYLDHRVVPNKIASLEATTLIFLNKYITIMHNHELMQLFAVEDGRLARSMLSLFQLNWRILSGHHLIMAENPS